MDNKQTEPLPTWVAPQLIRLNQADGTDKHVTVNTEGIPSPYSGFAVGPS